jgi:hypothetical protein
MIFFKILPWIGNNMHPFFSSPDPKGHVSVCHQFAPVVRPSTITEKYSLLKPLGNLRLNFGGMVRGWSTSKIVSDCPDLQPTWSLLLKIKKRDAILKMFISETTGPIETKLCLDSPSMIPFQNCVQQPRQQTNMVAVVKNRKRGMTLYCFPLWIKVPNSEQSYKGKVQTHNYINRQNQSTTGKLWKP